jgi:hypothetical protein
MVLLVRMTIFSFVRLNMLVTKVFLSLCMGKCLMCVLVFVWLAVVLVFGRPVSVG